MMTNVAKLLCIASLSTLAMSAYAQTDTKSSDKATIAQGTTAPGTSNQGSAGTQSPAANGDYKTALAACDAKPATERDQCRKDADAKFKAMAPSGSNSDKIDAPAAVKPKDDSQKSGSAK